MAGIALESGASETGGGVVNKRNFVVEYKYKIRYAPTTGTTLAIVEAETAQEAMELVLENSHVETAIRAWLLGQLCRTFELQAKHE